MLTPSSHRTALAVAALAAFTLCYAGVASSLMENWTNNYLYSYGFAVPFVAAYIAWTRAQEKPLHVAAPDYILGVPAIIVAITMLVVGRLGGLQTVEQTSLVLALTGLVLLVFGREAFKTHWFAIGYLLLMVPVWNYPFDRLQDPSRLLSTRIAVSVLHGIGVPALRQGTNIVLSSHTLSVLQECSGVNQLIALTAMVLPAAYLWLDTNTRRAIVLLFSVVVSYVGNGARIAMVGWLALHGLGDGDPNGHLHVMEGLGISAAGYLLIGACFTLLSKWNRTIPSPEPVATRWLAMTAQRHLALDMIVLAVLLVAGTARLSATQVDIGLNRELKALDTRIGTWILDTVPAGAIEFPDLDDQLVGGYPTLTGKRRFTSADAELIRSYRPVAGTGSVDLYVAYYERQEQGKELAGDASESLGFAGTPLTLHGSSETYEVGEIVKEYAGRQRGVLFWYDINGRIVRDIYVAKRHTIWDALTRRRTNGAVVMIGWSGTAGPEATAARQRAMSFAQDLMPVLRHYLPS